MAITVNQWLSGVANKLTAATVRVPAAGGIALTAGDVVFVMVAHDDVAGIVSATLKRNSDDAGLVSSPFRDVIATNTSHCVATILSILVSETSTQYVNVAWTGAGPAAQVISIISATGINASQGAGRIDKSSTGTGTSTSASSGATATLSRNDELAIGLIAIEGIIGDSVGDTTNNLPSAFTVSERLATAGSTAATNIMINSEFLILSANSAATAGKANITSRSWAALVAVYVGEVYVKPQLSQPLLAQFPQIVSV